MERPRAAPESSRGSPGGSGERPGKLKTVPGSEGRRPRRRTNVVRRRPEAKKRRKIFARTLAEAEKRDFVKTYVSHRKNNGFHRSGGSEIVKSSSGIRQSTPKIAKLCRKSRGCDLTGRPKPSDGMFGRLRNAKTAQKRPKDDPKVSPEAPQGRPRDPQGNPRRVGRLSPTVEFWDPGAPKTKPPPRKNNDFEGFGRPPDRMAQRKT